MYFLSICIFNIFRLISIKSIFRYKVYRVTPTSNDHVNFLKSMSQVEFVDFWSEVRSLNKSVDVMVAPHAQGLITSYFKNHRIHYEILIENVEE